MQLGLLETESEEEKKPDLNYTCKVKLYLNSFYFILITLFSRLTCSYSLTMSQYRQFLHNTLHVGRIFNKMKAAVYQKIDWLIDCFKSS